MSAWPTHRPQLLAVFILTALSAAVLFFVLQKPVFEARASIHVAAETKTDMKNAQVLLRSSSLAGQVLAAVGGDRLFPEADTDEMLRLFRQQLQVKPGGSSRMFNIVFSHHEEKLAAEAVNVLIRLFAAELEKLERAALEQELILRRKRLRQAENATAMMEKNRPPMPDVPPENARQEGLELLLAGAAEKERVLAEELDELRRQFTAAAAGQGGGVQEDWTAFLDMKLYERELLRKYKEDDPLLASVRQQLEMQRARLRQHGGQTAEKLAGQIAEAAEALGGQREERENVQRQLNQLAAHAGQQNVPESRTYIRLRDDLEDNRDQLAQQDRLVTVVEQPVLPLKPVRPKQPRAMLAAACFGLLCSLLHALLLRRKERGAA
uniref:hypothetical protein n=1 Tax=Candidatus Electronema sp. TaxID=2698783 RepID=UPI0040575A4B